MSSLRFLLLEDSLLDTELIQALLTEGSIVCDLVQVKTRIDFQTALEQGGFDLILSDYSLPGFDGIAALEMAQQFCPDVPFIFVTATMGEEVAIETLKSGATDYVLKQRLDRLLPSVKRALREAAERSARQQAEQALRARETELRKQKEELEKANRLKDEFLAVLSHELRSPLNAILGWSKILRTQQLDTNTLKRGLEIIERNAHLQTQLIEDLLDISQIIRGKLTLRPQPTSLLPVIEAAIDTVRLAAQAKSINLEFEVLGTQNAQFVESFPAKFCVLGDSSRLQQIVWNLLSNAIKFTPTDGRVTVTLELVETKTTPLAYAQITVRDTGIGISPDFLPFIFDSFRQEDCSITRKHTGLGLGLAIVRRLVELHGGTVTASSPGEGQGATFTICLPLLKDNTPQRKNRGQESPGSSHSISNSPLAGIKILVVDDDFDSRDFLVFALENYGAIATAVDCASAAMKVLVSFQPNVLLSDIGMPEEDGYELIRQVRALPQELGGNIPAIALTAYAGAQDRNDTIQAGFQKHLSKPIMPDELVAAIAELVN